MQNSSLREQLSIIWHTWKHIKKNLHTYISHANEQARSEVMNKTWIKEYAYQIVMDEDIAESHEETEDFIPAMSTVYIEGDGFSLVFNNTSQHDKTVFMSIKHRSVTSKYIDPPPLYEEGEPNGD